MSMIVIIRRNLENEGLARWLRSIANDVESGENHCVGEWIVIKEFQI